jgi:hypothetical protein
VFSRSYRRLNARAARLFRLLGLHPGPDITTAAAASLTAVPPRQAGQALHQLAGAYLVTEHSPGRYSLHDLLRAYATELAAEQEPEAERHAAVGRVLDYYLHTANAATRLLEPSREPITLAPPRTGVKPDGLATRQEARAWFEAERQVLRGAVSLAAETGFDARAWQLPLGRSRFPPPAGALA